MYANAKKLEEKHEKFCQTSKLQFSAASDSQGLKPEVLFTKILLEYSVPIAADRILRMFAAMFSNSAEVKKKISCGRTKTEPIIKKIISFHLCHVKN